MAAVARQLLVVEGAGRLRRVAERLLRRRFRHHRDCVLVAELGESGEDPERPRAGGAVRDHRSVRILCDLGQARLDLGHRQVHGPGCRRWRAPGRCGRRSGPERRFRPGDPASSSRPDFVDSDWGRHQLRIARTAGYSRRVSRRLRVAIVVAVAVAAAAVAVGAVVVAGDEPETKRPSGAPPFVVDLAVRTDPEAKALRRAAQAFERGDRRRAGGFSRAGRRFRPGSAPPSRPGPPRPSRAWRTASRRIRRAAPSSSISGSLATGTVTRTARSRRGARPARDPDSAYAVRASDLLFRSFPPGLPTFIPSFRADRSITRLGPAEQLAALARNARGRDVRGKLLYGLALQRLDRPISARRQYARAPSSRLETRSARRRRGWAGSTRSTPNGRSPGSARSVGGIHAQRPCASISACCSCG